MLKVQDTGSASPRDLPYIFDRFYRAILTATGKPEEQGLAWPLHARPYCATAGQSVLTAPLEREQPLKSGSP